MALTLIRHAPLPKEYQNRFIGWSDIPIDIKSFNKEIIKKISNRYFEEIFSSDLIRCTDTLKVLGFDKFTTDKRLREVKFKDYIEGRSFDEISQRDDFKFSYLDSMESWHRYIASETPKDFRDRIESFLNQLDTKKNILICTHKGVIREILNIYGYDNSLEIEYLSIIEIDI